jgi:hypothetical protein
VRVTTVPDAYVPPLGDRVTAPPFEGEATAVSVYFVTGGITESLQEATIKQLMRRKTTLSFIIPSLA